MTKETIDKVRNIFDENNIWGLDRFHLYIHAVIAEFVFSDSDSAAQFSDYRAAWNSSKAEVFKKYLSVISIEGENLLFELCNYVHSSDGIDFICSVSPDLFTGDICALFGYLSTGQVSRRAFIYNLIKLFALYRYRAFLYSCSYPLSPSRFSNDEILMLIYTYFDGWQHAVTYTRLLGFRENIIELWLLAFGAPFVSEKVRATGVAGIMG